MRNRSSGAAMPIFLANANVSLFHMGVLFKSVPSTSKMAARIFSESLNMKAPFKKADKKARPRAYTLEVYHAGGGISRI